MIEQTPPTRHYSTNEFADRLRIKPATIRRNFCVKGHYLGLRPVKLPNHRLVWPAAHVEAILAGKEVA